MNCELYAYLFTEVEQFMLCLYMCSIYKYVSIEAPNEVHFPKYTSWVCKWSIVLWRDDCI